MIVVNVPAAGVTLPTIPSTVPLVNAPVVVIALDPLSIDPNPDVIEPESSAPTVTKLAALVMLACVPPVTVAAVPEVFPVTLPVISPAKFVAAVITPPSIALLPTSTDPKPDVIEPESSAPTVTKLAALVMDACVPLVTVAAVPLALPVTLPVILPAKFVAAVITPPSIALLPTSTDPKPDVIEPESSAPIVTTFATVVIAA
jgi:hypothetical protein